MARVVVPDRRVPKPSGRRRAQADRNPRPGAGESIPGLPGAGVVAREDEVTPIERGIALGVVGALVGAAALRRARARCARAAGPAGWGSSSRRCRPSAERTMPASRHSASRVCRVARGRRWEGAERLDLGRRGGRCEGARARRARAATARRANTKHSLSEFEARRLAPCRPVQEDSPTAYSPGRVERACEVGDDPAHHVVRRRGDRDELARRVEAGLAQRGDDVGEVGGVDRAHVESDRRARRTPAGAARSRARPRRGGRARRRSARRRRRAGSRPRRGSPR